MHFVVTIETAERIQGDSDIDQVMDALADFGVAIGDADAAGSQITVTIPADDLEQAARLALSLIRPLATPLAITEALPEEIRDAREGWTPVPDLVDVAGAAQILGMTPQWVRQLIDAGTLPATTAGTRATVLPRSAVEALAKARNAKEEGRVTKTRLPKESRVTMTRKSKSATGRSR